MPQSIIRNSAPTLEFSSKYKRIAVEEAWAPAEMYDVFRAELASGNIGDPGLRNFLEYYFSDAERATRLLDRIVEAGPDRIAAMDGAGVDMQVLSLTAPGVQALRKQVAVPLAIDVNDRLSAAVGAYPDRFVGLTAVAPQAPDLAAEEVRRGHDLLGFKGVIINSHTHGEYLDDTKFWPILEAAESLGTPVYLHPTTPSPRMADPYAEVGLEGAILGFAAETGLHLLRLITSGVFDRFPDLKLVVGHLGEALPFWLWRIDFMHDLAVRSGRHASIKPLKQKPSEYFRTNIWVTSSGMPWAPAITFVRDVIGADRLMFAWDYPYQWDASEVAATDALPWSDSELADLFQHTAERVFNLS